MSHGNHHVLDPGGGRITDDLVENRDHQVEAFDGKPRLAGERAMQELLERLDLRDAVEQLVRVDGIAGRPELAGFDRLPQPHPFLRHEDMVVVVARRCAINRAESLDGLQGVGRAFGGGPADDRCRQPRQGVAGQAVRLKV